MTREQFEHMKDEYYRLNGWDPVTGNPTSEKMVSLGLEFALG
jgi:aldehyde:ferredoxin oxidoreductase